jgi:hypothetical protein
MTPPAGGQPIKPAFIPPDDYARRGAAELLGAAECGTVAFDHRLLRVLLDDLSGVAAYANANPESTLTAELLSIFCHAPTAEALPFLVDLARELRDEMPEELIEAFARLGEPALHPLLELYSEFRDEPGDIPTAIAFLKVRDERTDAIFNSLPEEDADFLRDIAGGEGGFEEFDIFAHYPPEAAPYLRGLSAPERLEFLSSPDRGHRLAALATFFDRDVEPEAAARIAGLAREDADAEVRGVAWEALEGALDDDPALLKEMAARLADPSVAGAERAGLAVGLARKREACDFDAAVEQLYAEPATRARALQAMWRSFDRKWASHASRAVDDPDPEVVEQALLACGYCQSAADAGRIEKYFDDQDLRDTALFAYALCAPVDVTRSRMKQLFRRIEELAGGLTSEEAATVEQAIDLRMEMHGLRPVFGEDGEEPVTPPAVASAKVERNDPCPCGSGKKFKKCCGAG